MVEQLFQCGTFVQNQLPAGNSFSWRNPFFCFHLDSGWSEAGGRCAPVESTGAGHGFQHSAVCQLPNNPQLPNHRVIGLISPSAQLPMFLAAQPVLGLLVTLPNLQGGWESEKIAAKEKYKK